MSKLVQKVDKATGEETTGKVNSDEVDFPVLPSVTNNQTLRGNSSNLIEATSLIQHIISGGSTSIKIGKDLANLNLGKYICLLSAESSLVGFAHQRETNKFIAGYIDTTNAYLMLRSNNAYINFLIDSYTANNKVIYIAEPGGDTFYVKQSGAIFSRYLAGTGVRNIAADALGNIVVSNDKALKQGADQDSATSLSWASSDIVFTLSANTQYELNLNLLFDVSTELTGNIRLYSTQSFSAVGIVQKNAQDTPDMIHQSLNLSNSASVNYSLNASLGTGYSNIFKANLLVIATVDFQINLQFKQNVDDPLNWIRLKAGSYGVVRKA